MAARRRSRGPVSQINSEEMLTLVSSPHRRRKWWERGGVGVEAARGVEAGERLGGATRAAGPGSLCKLRSNTRRSAFSGRRRSRRGSVRRIASELIHNGFAGPRVLGRDPVYRHPPPPPLTSIPPHHHHHHLPTFFIGLLAREEEERGARSDEEGGTLS
ncbi:unnamed protein product [Pleuronectes platessa]|uniref:Uncharacterized protein n=1 Tax=Pleuronectes platessa TaxID=8262 RepID=A0A9N7TMR4_PLEPL|nr:unnamed protein product [Pleuronectes platessa]